MAMINGIKVFALSENVSRSADVTTHPVENGADITDHVRKEAAEISVSGEIVGKDAQQILSQINALYAEGKFVTYTGRNILKNAVIVSFNTGHTNKVSGGCTFDMTLREVFVAGRTTGRSTTNGGNSISTASTSNAGQQQVVTR